MYFQQEENNTIVIEKSRFICYMKRVRSEEEYREYLASIKKKHYDATHVCSAMICDSIQRSSDDGEPSGTAGAPILNVLKKNDLNQMCALVVRYFGGVKLGAGGLIRAYTNAVSECVKKAVIVEEYRYPLYELKLSYEAANRIDNYLRKNTIIDDIKYTEDVCFIFAVDDERKLETIKEYTKGQEPELIGDKIIEKVVK